MKTFKRFSAILLAALMLVAMMAAPASAAEGSTQAQAQAETYTITINAIDDQHTYVAYQIFSGVLYTTTIGEKETVTLSDIEWGTSIKTESQGVGEGKLGEAATKAGSLGTTSADAHAFANELVKGGHLADPVKESTYADGQYTISGLEPGYYLILDEAGSITPDEFHAYTDYIVKVVKDVNVDPKGAAPTLTKKVAVAETNTTFGQSVNSGIGRKVYFELNGSMPSEIGTYKTYALTFEDTLPEGLTFDEGSVKVYLTNDNDGSYSREITSGFTAKHEDGKITVAVTDAVATIQSLTNSHPLAAENIVVKYSATLNTNAEIGKDGNENTAIMKFSNDPNKADSYGTTSEQTAKVYTYSLKLEKVDENNNKLANAKFILWRYEGSSNTDIRYATAINEGNGVYTITGVDKDKSKATEFVSAADGTIVIKGIADGTYHMTETAPPAGYNTLDSNFGFQITAALDANTGAVSSFTATQVGSITEVRVTQDANNCIALITVQNTAGSSLPETGGIGTTIFYGIGGVLVLGALSLLIVRKRTTAK